MIKTPETIEVEAWTGFKGQGPKGLVKLRRFTMQETITHFVAMDNLNVTKATEKFNKGYRIYGRYANRYGITYMRSPKGVLSKIHEQWG